MKPEQSLTERLDATARRLEVLERDGEVTKRAIAALMHLNADMDQYEATGQLLFTPKHPLEPTTEQLLIRIVDNLVAALVARERGAPQGVSTRSWTSCAHGRPFEVACERCNLNQLGSGHLRIVSTSEATE